MRLTEELRFDTTPSENSDPATSGATWRPSPPSGSGRGNATGSNGPAFDVLDPSEIDPAFQIVVNSILGLSADRAVAAIGRYQAILTATETDIISSHQASGATPRQTEDLIGQGGKRSKKDKKQRAKRGETLKNNPDLKDDIADGTVSEEQLDDLANADAKTDGAASQDPDLLDEIRNSNPDQSKDTIKDFVNEHNKPDAETEHERQRRLRQISRYTDKDGLDTIKAAGDAAAINAIWNALCKDANDLYLKDGGRDVSPSKHPRSHTQRLFDAFALAFSSTGAGSVDSNRSGTRPTIVVGISLDADGNPINPVQFGSGPLPQNVFDRHFCNATISGAVFSGSGQLLWHGRNHRTATPAQLTGLIARDKGCVLCRAHPQRCEAHHILPWSAPGKGRTDIDNLALLCTDCHHMVHDTHKTLYKDASGHWTTRAAKASEIAPTRKPGPTPPPPPGRRRRGASEPPNRPSRSRNHRSDE